MWVEARGFGFIRPEDGGKDVFCHLSILDRSGVPLHCVQRGDLVEIETDLDRSDRPRVCWIALVSDEGK